MFRRRWCAWRPRSRRSSPSQPDLSEEGEDDEPVVSLSHRSIPLVELLKAAAKAECDVMWESNT